MEEVLRSKEMDKIEELFHKSFDLSSNIVFFPVRHHSPACSFHLIKTIEEYLPEIILIEGPVDGNNIKEFLEDENSKPPFAIYYSYSDTKSFINEHKEKYKCYYPFLSYSPELIALREGKSKEIKTEFIDLSYSEILINSNEGKGLLKSEDKLNYNDDYLFSKSEFFKILCKKENCRNFNELWEKLFEINGLNICKEEFVKAMLSYCYLTRINTKEEELIEEGCIVREKFMANRIQEACKNYKKILVVTGGFHTYGIINLLNKDNKVKLHKFNKGDCNVYVMPYSMEATNQINGYASGMPFPNFYEEVWNGIENKKYNSYKNSVLKFIIKTGKKVRKNNGCLSTFDEICAFNMCEGLASLRNKKSCGLYELIDGITSSFIKGDLNLSTEEPLNLLYKEITGNKVGSLCESANVPPLVQDFKLLSEKYKLKIRTTVSQDLTLEVFSSKRHRDISKMLHRMNYLNTDFCKLTKGPNILNRTNMNLIRESWTYKWNTSIDSVLIDNSVYGGTLEEACLSIVKKELNNNKSNAGNLSKILVQAFYMGLNEVFNSTLFSLSNAISQDGSFYSLIDCIKNLNCLYNMRSLYRMNNILEIKEIIFNCYSKLSILIPNLYSTESDEGLNVANALKEIFNTILNKELELDESILVEALKSLLRFSECNALIEGAVIGILYGLNEFEIKAISSNIEGYILGTKDKVLKAPDFLGGLFSTAKDVLFIDKSILISIDKIVKSIPTEDFIKVVPQLRLAFSFFAPREVDEIGEKVAQIYNISKKKFVEVKGISQEVVDLGVELDKYVVKIINEEVL